MANYTNQVGEHIRIAVKTQDGETISQHTAKNGHTTSAKAIRVRNGVPSGPEDTPGQGQGPPE